MKKANLKSMNKQTKSMLITYAMVIAVFIIVEVMVCLLYTSKKPAISDLRQSNYTQML